MFKKLTFIVIIIIISGLSGILANRFIFPYLCTTKLFSKYDFLRKSAEDVTVINKTEQVYVKEETSIVKVAGSAISSVVNIISYPNPEAKILNKPLNATRNSAGIVVTSDGLIMTYLDAIDPENSRYKIMTEDDNVYDAELIGIDSYSNLAFLKTSASNLPAVSFGNSDEAEAGEKIIAIGNNLAQYQNRFAIGVLGEFNPFFNLSGKTLSSSEKTEGVFESDLNWQDSYVGGPIVDYSGQVIGIIGKILKDNHWTYFQIPSNKAKLAIDKAIKKELSQSAELGVYYIPLNKTYTLVNNLKIEKGALIYSPSGQQGLAVIIGSPAQKAGLKIGDIITAINGEEINSAQTLPDLLYKYKVNDMIELSVTRDGGELKIKVQL